MRKDKNFHIILQEEVNNFGVTSRKFPAEVDYVNKVLLLYQNLASNLEKDYPRDLTPILQMYWTCFTGFLISTRLIFEIHIPESYAIISRSAEAVASARRMSLQPEKIPEWIKKEKQTSQPFRRLLGKLFPTGDKVVFPELFKIYELTSEYGRHPNFASTIFFSDFGQMKTNNQVVFNYPGDIDDLNIKRCINYQINSYLKFLSIFQEIFKKYLSKEWTNKLKEVESEYSLYKESLRKELSE